MPSPVKVPDASGEAAEGLEEPSCYSARWPYPGAAWGGLEPPGDENRYESGIASVARQPQSGLGNTAADYLHPGGLLDDPFIAFGPLSPCLPASMILQSRWDERTRPRAYEAGSYPTSRNMSVLERRVNGILVLLRVVFAWLFKPSSAAMSTTTVYFELSWSILSTIGIGNVFFGFLVCSITSFSQISAVPVITSIAGSIANGLCYYAFYADGTPLKGQAVASAFADLLWLIQEAGLSFYSYVILSRVLRNRRWQIFAALFWTIIVVIAALRIMIAVTRVRSILDGGDSFQKLINNLHIGYFVSIAVIECVSAYFLITVFASAKTTSLKAAIKTGLFRYLMRSSEIRLALLAVLGVMRAVTYSFQTSAQSATNIASQVDRFAYTMECLFPFVMYIDMLASRLVFTDQAYASSSRSHRNPRQFTSNNNGGLHYSVAQNEQVIEVQGGGSKIQRTSSQERIIEAGTSQRTPSEIELDEIDKRTGINKTVNFEVYETYTPAK
ncbi:hypothetical protein G7Z17_g1915 [Cylindrodendrum hubeiense]|uniref:Uncharacterized protein n=1 Tax=Cylindrodendrum hubeiense TaxID=595255 RepID=A0A9P5HDW9_9HYPO|nr:hypothetical protein G7Z17_g1915 [Cylindrodendrum hubeiense]